MIYFAECQKSIKIGYTDRKVEERIKELQTGNPYQIKILHRMPGSKTKEVELHHKFANLRKVGSEWFKADKTLLGFISNLAKKNANTRTKRWWVKVSQADANMLNSVKRMNYKKRGVIKQLITKAA